MFNKTRRKIVFTVVLSLLALMAVTLGTIYFSNRAALRRESENILNAYVERFTLDGQPAFPNESDKPDDKHDFAPPEPRDNESFRRIEPAFRLSTFYSVAYSESGEVLAINNGNRNMQSDESLLELASSVLEKGKRSGAVGSMTYILEEREDYTLVAMLDGTINDNNQKTLIKLMLIIGASALAVLFVISIFIARRIVRPLEENDKRQKRFVSDAGHELKTPIAVISANSELLRRQSGESEWLDNIDYENGRMSELVKQLLALSHAENGDLPTETLDFSQLVSGEVLPFEPLAFEKGARIESDVEDGVTVEGNPNQLRQLVSILLDNALSHGTGDEIAVSLKRDKHSAVLAVANDAAGLDAEKASRLFDRFYRGDEARGDAGSHYGLGLSIAKAVAEAHKGEIRADCKDGRAVFTVTLPVKKA